MSEDYGLRLVPAAAVAAGVDRLAVAGGVAAAALTLYAWVRSRR